MAATKAAASVLLPACGMAALTGAVWVKLYVDRLGEMGERKIKPQQLATRQAAEGVLKVTVASDNFKNLFELPVLFYAICVAHAASGLAPTPTFLRAAWTFVALRAAHSAIHVTYNNVMHRFTVYAVSTIVLFSMWAGFTRRLLAATA